MGLRSKGHSHLLTLVEQKTRKLFIERVKSKNPWETMHASNVLIKKHNISVKTITIDNGPEFNTHDLLAYQNNFKVYQCAYLLLTREVLMKELMVTIRQWCPKGTDFN